MAVDRILQSCLRPEEVTFAIATEYPTVLSSHNKHRSYCLYDETETIAHVNLLPRLLYSKEKAELAKIGLLGNVATAPQWQGKGIMKELMRHIFDEAKRLNLDASSSSGVISINSMASWVLNLLAASGVLHFLSAFPFLKSLYNHQER